MGIGNESLSSYTRYISLIVGQKIKLIRPGGYKGVSFKEGADAKQFANGFKIYYPELGEFTEVSKDTEKSWVVYLHKKSGKQVIEFMSAELGVQKFHLVAQGVTIHDHASIEMGGPAFATYYSEPVNATNEEGS